MASSARLLGIACIAAALAALNPVSAAESAGLDVPTMQAAAANAGCSKELEVVLEKSKSAKIDTYQLIPNRELSAVLAGQPPEFFESHRNLTPEELIFSFASEPIKQAARIFPTRGMTSTTSQYEQEFKQLEDIAAQNNASRGKRGDAPEIARASRDLKKCMLFGASTPTAFELANSLATLVKEAGCSAQLGALRDRTHEDYRDFMFLVLALQVKSRENGGPARWQRPSGNFVYINGLMKEAVSRENKRLSLKASSTLPVSPERDADEQRRNEVDIARLAFWTCATLTPQGRAPDANWTIVDAQEYQNGEAGLSVNKQFIPNACGLVTCSAKVENDQTTIACAAKAVCLLRMKVSGRLVDGSCRPLGAMKDQEVASYFDENTATPRPYLCAEVH